ncbi:MULTISPECIES: sensor histidine kinase [Anaerotruncus]|uniref:sensor histidine kinase n=2 Tax=Oscillospiraceae TaxID=216572 RepID=UPI0009ABD913|nr:MULTISPECIES: histidine kinase [Anaerotruncus]RGX55396.1 HAMP domain-containing protein [Anaerotruncus sp. AF02-27]
MKAIRRFCRRCADWWLSVSIRRKMLLFTGAVIFMVLFVTLFSVGMVNLYLRDFNVILGDSYAVNAVLSDFEAENTSFFAYANYRTTENRQNYTMAMSETNQSMQNLRFDLETMDRHRYLQTQGLKVSHLTYREECTKLLRMTPDTDSYITQYYYVVKIGNYIEGYAKELLQTTVAKGNVSYHEKVETFRILPVLAVSVSLLTVILATLLCSLTVRQIINPLLKLAGAAKRIAANDMYVPDLRVQNRDEIGELVQTFNVMKHSMYQSITTLREKNEIESRLHLEEVQRINAEQMLKTAQMSLLQSQINPHFLFNTLNIISRMAKIEHAPDTEELIRRLANLFRYNLQTASERVTLTRELNIISDYMYIQRKRFGDRLGYVVDCRDVDTDQVMVPTFTLQPLVENAVIHGVAPKEEGGRIRIRIRMRGGRTVITVTDSGQGIPPELLAILMRGGKNHRGHLSGIGVGNVRTRIGTLHPGSTFRIFSRVGMGTAIRMELPDETAIKAEKGGTACTGS